MNEINEWITWLTSEQWGKLLLVSLVAGWFDAAIAQGTDEKPQNVFEEEVGLKFKPDTYTVGRILQTMSYVVIPDEIGKGELHPLIVDVARLQELLMMYTDEDLSVQSILQILSDNPASVLSENNALSIHISGDNQGPIFKKKATIWPKGGIVVDNVAGEVTYKITGARVSTIGNTVRVDADVENDHGVTSAVINIAVNPSDDSALGPWKPDVTGDKGYMKMPEWMLPYMIKRMKNMNIDDTFTEKQQEQVCKTLCRFYSADVLHLGIKDIVDLCTKHQPQMVEPGAHISYALHVWEPGERGYVELKDCIDVDFGPQWELIMIGPHTYPVIPGVQTSIDNNVVSHSFQYRDSHQIKNATFKVIVSTEDKPWLVIKTAQAVSQEKE